MIVVWLLVCVSCEGGRIFVSIIEDIWYGRWDDVVRVVWLGESVMNLGVRRFCWLV